ncbi:MAG: MarR family transcriptional regulator [Propionibacteriaceae bacterium]|jgi:DNA-binding MarR family transcriptional regulator|nr:MarR family transcriptional regulator [Propionibacteriaceae bacterium]
MDSSPVNAKPACKDNRELPSAAVDAASAIRPLIMRLLGHLDSEIAALASSRGLTVTQAVALRELETKITMRQLSQRICAKPTNVTAVVDKLEKLGLLIRENDPEDRRVTRLALTEKGRAMRGELLDECQVSPLLIAMPEARLRQLAELLREAAAPADS